MAGWLEVIGEVASLCSGPAEELCSANQMAPPLAARPVNPMPARTLRREIPDFRDARLPGWSRVCWSGVLVCLPHAMQAGDTSESIAPQVGHTSGCMRQAFLLPGGWQNLSSSVPRCPCE